MDTWFSPAGFDQARKEHPAIPISSHDRPRLRDTGAMLIDAVAVYREGNTLCRSLKALATRVARRIYDNIRVVVM